MREHHIAHRDLRRANVLVDGDGGPWITGFAFSEVAASGEQLDGDMAELLAALSLTVGAERAVTSAVATLGPQTVGAALSRLQPNALSGSTRAELEEASRLVRGAAGHRRAAVRGERAELRPARTDQQAAPLRRGDARGGHVLPGTAAGRPAGRGSRGRRRHWGWVPLVVLFSAVTYVGAALGVGGASAARLARRPDVAGAARRVVHEQPHARRFRRHGTQRAIPAEVGCGRARGGIERRAQRRGRLPAHIGLMFVFFVWAGQSALGSISVPSWPVIAISAAVVAVCTRGVRDSCHPRGTAHEARARARPRVQWSRGGDSESRQDRARCSAAPPR